MYTRGYTNQASPYSRTRHYRASALGVWRAIPHIFIFGQKLRASHAVGRKQLVELEFPDSTPACTCLSPIPPLATAGDPFCECAHFYLFVMRPTGVPIADD